MWGRFLTWLVTKFLAKHFPARYRLIPRRSDGAPLLRQFKITEWLYLQSFVNPEERDLFHVHRWRKMRSFVLSGEFHEERYPGLSCSYSGPHSGFNYYIEHRAPSTYSMDQTNIHRLSYVMPDTWTLFLMRGNERDWGYYPRPLDPGYIRREEAIPEQRKVKPL
jgi:hypothetical protein